MSENAKQNVLQNKEANPKNQVSFIIMILIISFTYTNLNFTFEVF